MRQDEGKSNQFVGPQGLMAEHEAMLHRLIQQNLKLREHNMHEMLGEFDGNKEKIHDMLDAMWSCYIANYGDGIGFDAIKDLNKLYIYLNRHIRASETYIEEKDLTFRG